MKDIKIENITISNNEKCFIIVEAGVNHNGSIEIAKKLVDEAVNIGADCIKFQTYKTENLVTKKAPKANYQLKVTDEKESQFEMLKKLELTLEEYKDLISYCSERNILFLSTPYNIGDIDFLNSLGVSAFKVASGQIVEKPFLEYLAKQGKPIIASTGMAYLSEIDEAVRVFRDNGNEDFVILQCTTNYPSLESDSNLKAMISMRDAFNCLVGYSDHTVSDVAILGSVALGAKIIEKHFTLDKNMEGPDHSCSADPEEMAELISKIRLLESALGTGVKTPCESEIKNTQGMRRSLVFNRDIKEGETLKQEDIGVKRPATGIHPNLIDQFVGKVVTRDISLDDQVSFGDVKWD